MTVRQTLAGVMAAAIAIASTAGSAQAQARDGGECSSEPEMDGPPGLVWEPEWRRVDWVEGSVILASAGAATVMLALGEREEPRWTAAGPVDRAARRGLALGTRRGRERISLASDALLLALMLYPVLVDALLVAGVAEQEWEVAKQLAVIDLQSLMLSYLVSMGTSRYVARQRPFMRECDTDPDYAKECTEQNFFAERNTSFIGGHALVAFSAAGLVCVHHQYLDLYGSNAADTAACGVALAAAGGVFGMRMAAERHWLSDMLVGAGLGLAAGWLLPAFAYYRRTPGSSATGWMSPMVAPTPGGGTVGLQGTF